MKPLYFSGILILLVTYFSPALVSAEPYLAIKTEQKCSSCHVNPIGGGMRNAYGRLYGYAQLPAHTNDFNSAEIGALSEFFQLGGDLRYNAQQSRDEAGNQDSTFRIDSAQLYMQVKPGRSGLSLYLDQQVAPGSAVNREAFVMYSLSSGHYLKAGKMYIPFGLRIEDDTSFVRQVTGFNFDASDNGAELGLEYARGTVNLFVSNGTSAVSNNDDDFLYGARLEHLFEFGRAGLTFVTNDGELADQTIVNLYAGTVLADVVLMGEVNWLNTEQSSGIEQEQLVSLVGANYSPYKGINLKLTAEYYDPNRDVSEDQETRYSLVAEYTPFAHLQFRGGYRKSDSIPQFPQRDLEHLFLQVHVYF